MKKAQNLWLYRIFAAGIICLVGLIVVTCGNGSTSSGDDGPKPGDLWTSPGGIEFSWIPAGTFTMGPDIWNNDATFSVTLSAFKMSRYAVTQELYEEVIGDNPSYYHGGSGRKPDGTEIQGMRPVETVSWFDAIEFCNKLSDREGLDRVYATSWSSPATHPITSGTVTADFTKNGYRLPTDAQWEYACCAGTSTKWHFGDDETKLVEYAWYSANSNNKTHQVGLLKPNQWSLYDMHGNVWEWCWDWYDDYPAGPETNYTGTGAGSGRVERGGSWVNTAGGTRSVSRSSCDPDGRYFILGFRLVRP